MNAQALLPPNATALERALAQTMAAQIGGLPVPLRDLWNPRTCPTSFLPWLAWTVGVESWDATWSDEVKRARIAAAIAILRHNGTEQAVRGVVAAYGGNVVLTLEDPFAFSLSVSVGGQTVPPTSAFIDSMIADVSRAKGARDRFTFSVSLNAIASIGVLGAGRPAIYARLECAA